MKGHLWIILEKYDSEKSMGTFCDSISNVIQGKETHEDLINLIKFYDVKESEMDVINESVNLKSILF